MNMIKFALPAIALTLSSTAFAANPLLGGSGSSPGSGGLDPIQSLGGRYPGYGDYQFTNTNLTANVADNGSGYTLKIYSSSPQYSTFTLSGYTSIAATTSYALTAYFDYNDAFKSGSLNITGTLNPGYTLPSGVSAPSDTNLYAANLVKFGFNNNDYSDNQHSLGFNTAFLPSWIDQSSLTGGSAGETVYLFDNVLNGANTPFAALVNAFAVTGGLHDFITSNPTGVSGSVNSLTSVPVPMSAVLFASGLSALLGLKRRKSA